MPPTMLEKKLDSAVKLINEEINQVLEIYPEDPYKRVFTIPELRQKLIDYVMKGIQGNYPSDQNRQPLDLKSKLPYRSLELRLRIENYIHWGVEYIFQSHVELNKTNLDLFSNSSITEPQPNYTPSHWFG